MEITTIHWKRTCLLKIQIFSVRKIRRQSEKTAQCVAQHRLSDQTHLISGLVGPEARQNRHNDFWRLYEEQIVSRSYGQKTL